MNNWSRESKNSSTEVLEAGQLMDDKFTKLWSNRKVEAARVAISVAEGLDYGVLKVSATVSLSCDQNEAAINKAGELAFYKALELVRDGFGVLNGTSEPSKKGG